MSRIKLGDHFTYSRLGRFVLPSIVMMLFTSIYGIVDGLFVSNFVGKTAFAAVNLDMPYMMMISALGFMIGTGGSALVAMQLGEQKNNLAKRTFSMLVWVLFAGAIVISVISAIFMPQICGILGADKGQLLDDAVLYGRISMVSMPMFMLQNSFQSFLVTAEKPKLGLVVTVGAGVTNMVLDLVLVGMLRWGIAGAAIATVASEYVGGLLPVIYFLRKNDSLLQLVKPVINWHHVLKACTNGVSELMTNIAGSVVSIAYNLQLMRLAGENGVAAYGVVMYVTFIFAAVFFGYMIGSSPLYSYHYAAGNYEELQNLYRKSTTLAWSAGVILCSISFILAPAMSRLFVGYDTELLALTVHSMKIMSITFIFMGVGVFGSGFFTALGNGIVSAVIAFMRTIVFQLSAVIVLPLIMSVDGIWWSGPVSSLMTTVLTLILLQKYKSRYHYSNSNK